MTPHPLNADPVSSQSPPPLQQRFPRALTLPMAGRRFGLPPRAIRHYEERALVRLSRDSMGRRIFDAVQCARLELIAALRAAEVPLAEIERVLATADPQRSRAIAMTSLERRLQQIDESRASTVAALDRLRRHGGSLGWPITQSTL